MSRTIKRLAAVLMAAVLLACAVPATSAEAAVKRPSKCSFLKWNNKSFTACRVFWSKVSGLTEDDYYEIKWTPTNSSTSTYRYQYSNLNILDIKDLSSTKIYKVQARVVKNATSSNPSYSDWSSAGYIVPMPRKISATIVDDSNGYVRLNWNKISGAKGYSVWLTTNPSGTWYHYQNVSSGTQKVTLKKYRGSKFKANTNYYVRVFPRNYVDGEYLPVAVPSDSYSSYKFRLYVHYGLTP